MLKVEGNTMALLKLGDSFAEKVTVQLRPALAWLWWSDRFASVFHQYLYD